MSKQTDLLELEKCIVSRLWYTAVTILRHQTDTIDQNKSQRDIKLLTNFIRSCADQGLQEHRWIAYNLLSQLDNTEEAKKILTQEEFVSILKLLETQIPHHTKVELLKLFESVRAAKEKNDVPACKLSPESLDCLETNILKNPALIHWIIDGLLCIWLPTHFAQSDSALQDVYFNSIKKLFDFDEKRGENERTSLLKRNGNNLGKKNLGVFLSILSKINLTETKEDELLDWLYPALLNYCNNDDIELALYSRRNAKFFKNWHEFLDDTYARCSAADNLENATKISKILFDFNEDSTTSLNANEIFKRTLNRQTHWLIDIFDICYVLLINEGHSEVERILDNSVLKDFWLLLLFKLLKDCPIEPVYSPETWERSVAICGSLKFILTKIEKSSKNDETLLRLKTTLKNHLDVLDWILKSKQTSSLTNGKISTVNYPNFTVKQALHLLQNHSILAVLKMTTDIHKNNCEEISELLKDTEDSKSIFQAYRAMLSALKAILLCEFYNSDYQKVAERFNEMEKSLGSLFPLDLRLEVIENIFSMLFLRYEDFVEADSGSEGGDEDSMENMKKIKQPTKTETGFLCNKYATRETLNRLRRSVTAVEFEFAEQKNDSEANDRFKKNIALISKALADATWRLELLTSSDFIEKRGNPDSENRECLTKYSTILPDYRLSYSSSKNKTIFYKPNESSSDESELIRSDLEGSSEAGSQGNATNNSARRRKRLRKNSSITEPSITAKDSEKRERTLNCMLASKESLVLQCLWKSDYDRASQVIEMFSLKNSHLEGEILFSRAIKTFRKEMKRQLANSDAVDSPDVDTKQTTLENIRRAVQDGFHASRSTGQVETFLAAQESCVRLLNNDSTTSKEILTLASLDLSLTMSRTHQDSLNLSGVTMKYLQSCKKLSTTRYYDFFQSIYQSLYENNCDLSINEILCDARIPLCVKKAKEKMDYWSRLFEKLKIFRKSLCQNNFDDSINEDSLNPSEKAFEEIIMICDNGELYLPRIHAHLKLLRTIIPEDNSDANEADFCLLKTSLDTYIGDQIFRLNLELDEIESIASRLQVNLVHSILVNCCPKLRFYTDNSLKTSEKWGTTVLNNTTLNFTDCNNFEPNQCVTNILSELLEAIRKVNYPNLTLKPTEARELSKNEEIRRIFDKTQKIASADLSNLSFGNHTLAFFINIWNLMILHATIDIWSINPPIDDLRHEISLTTVGYEIGDLGIVSLQALRSKLLGQHSWGPQFFSTAEELNEPAWQDLDVPFDPRVIFALTNEFNDSPIIRIYNPKTLNDDLNASVNDYLNFYKKNMCENRNNCYPELINRYNDLITKKVNSSISVDENIVKIDTKVSYKELNYSYDVRFIYNDEKMGHHEIFETRETSEFPWQSRIVKSTLLQYLEGHCWLLSYLVQRIHEESPTILDSNCENIGRTASLENLVKSSWANNLKSLYEENQTVAGLRKITLTNEIWNYFQSLLLSGETKKCLNIINALPDSLITSNVEIQRFKDIALAYLATNSPDSSVSEILRYVYQIKDEQILAKLILSSANDLPVKVCGELLFHALSHIDKDKLPEHCKSRMNEISCRVAVFEKMLPYCEKGKNDENCWHDLVHQTEKTNPVKIVKSLIDANQFELCLEWMEYQAVSSEIHSLITQDLLIGLLNNEDQDFKHAVKLLRALPKKKSLNLCSGVVGKLEAIGALRFVVGYLLENSPKTENQRYKRGLLGIDILEQMEIKERRSYVHLIEHPLFMLEQLLMNCKLDSLLRILIGIKDSDCNNEYCEKFDETVRFYASKSLDFRVAVPGEIEKIKDSSVSSNISQNGDFLMPINIPTKDEWVPNDKARECSCCRVVIFTMFNRRHHCRRCGRVVCATCSPQRVRLPSYPNSVPVRVCNDCKRQMHSQLQAPSTPSSEAFDCWRLTVDEAHNETLREEFSFENAPNISLCLAILNLHSDHEAYSNFLLDKCDGMKDLLRPDSKGRVNPEVDHALIIKMIRSLLLAAKVKCAKLGLNTGLTHCDRFLSQVDLITTLVNSDCSSLIPPTEKDGKLGDHALRRLRDLLSEKEQWILALDVSTKTGLDTQGVWAAWGTACLKAGFYELARDKFARCLDKVMREDSDDWVMLSYPGETSSDRNKRIFDTYNFSSDDNRRKIGNSNVQEGLKNRPNKDPLLLTEILQILDKMNPNDCYNQQNSKINAKRAHEILNTLNSLKSISLGQLTLQTNSGTKNFRYQESLYYLLMYGSFNSILEFFVKNNEYDKCLAYILENDIEPEIFMNIFMRCLRNGCIVNLCDAMRNKDSSLVIFKKYLMHTCHCLERKQLLNTLHQLQLFMKDYVRAAMTCIRFYVTDANSYEDLCSRTHFLAEAQRHLESELQLESFGKKRRKSVSSSISGQYSLTLEMEPAEIDRHMNTISRQMEIAKFLGNRELEGQTVNEFMNKLSFMDSEGSSIRNVPTLFGNQQEKTHLAVLAILCGRDVEEGFGIAFRIMQDYNLRQQKIYSLVGHMLALDRKINSIEQLIKCCRSSGAPNSNAISDRVLAHCVKLLLDRSRTDSNPSPKDQIDSLIRIITDVELKIESYIESRQLKAAYLLAVKHSRAQDIRKILKEADRLGQLAIKSICTKWLQQTQGS